MNDDSKQLVLPLEYECGVDVANGESRTVVAKVSTQVETRLIMLEYEYQLTLPFEEKE